MCYEKLLNLCRQKVTKYFGKTQDFSQKEEISYLTLYRVYTAFRNKLNRLKQKNENAELFFYLSQLYSYVDMAARTQVIIYKNYERRVLKNTLEFQEDVDYTAPLDDFIGHKVEDFAYYVYQPSQPMESALENENEPNKADTESGEREELDNEIEAELMSVKVINGTELLKDKDGVYRCHTGLENFLLDNSLAKKEEEIGFEYLEDKINKYFDENEMSLIKSIYFNDDSIFKGTKREYNKTLASITKKVSNENPYLRYKIMNLFKEKRQYDKKSEKGTSGNQ